MQNPVLALRCQRSIALNHRAAAAIAYVRGNNPRERLAMSAVSLANEHHSGFVKLMETEHFASAAAMLRPIAEASTCAHWVTYVASPRWIAQVGTTRERDTPNLDRMITALANSGIPFEGIHELRKQLQMASWRRFHKFTHGGLSQLTRRESAQTFNQEENHHHLLLADTFFLAGAAIGTVWSADPDLRTFVVAEYSRVNTERVQAFGGPAVSDWAGLPPAPNLDSTSIAPGSTS